MVKNNINTFWNRVEKTNTCWFWTGYITKYGYGHISMNGHLQRVHRIAYELLVGKIPEGFQLDHLCRNRDCVNPKHLEVVTSKINVLRGIGLTAINKRKTHCLNGHEFTPKNTYIIKKGAKKGGRVCLPCQEIRQSAESYKEYQKRYKQEHSFRKQI